MLQSVAHSLSLLVFLATVPIVAVAFSDDAARASDDDTARALGAACYWQTSQGLSKSALTFRDRVQEALGVDLFRDCDVREQTWGVTAVECAPSADRAWTITLRVGFPGGLDRWQACVTRIESRERVIYSASFLFRYRAQIVAAVLLYGAYALVRALRRRRSN